MCDFKALMLPAPAVAPPPVPAAAVGRQERETFDELPEVPDDLDFGLDDDDE